MTRAVPLLLACALATPVRAQTVTGTVTDHAGSALRGAFVRLIDTQNRQRAAALTDSAGSFVLRAPGPGHYFIQADQIGFHATRADMSSLAADSVRRIELTLRANAFTLEAITAEAQSRCTAHADGSIDAQTIWDEARKALNVAAWTDETESLTFELTTWRRTLDRNGNPARTAPDDSSTASALRPFETRPASDLVRRGFIQPRGGGSFEFFAPDAQVLLSDEFLSTHCFRAIAANVSGRPLVGLAFEPLPARRTPDIAGVLWLDARTRELRAVEFSYRRLPWGQPDGSASGLVDFRRLPDGAWIINRWSIRIPRVEERPSSLSSGGRRNLFAVGFEEAGGVVVSHSSRQTPPDSARLPVPVPGGNLKPLSQKNF